MTDALHVLHLTPRLTRAAGGAWHYAEGLTQGLERVGVRCTLAGVAETDNQDAKSLKVTRVITGAPTILPANYGVSRELRRRVLAEVERVDLVHAHGFRVGTDLLAMKVAAKHRVPILLSPHGQLHPSIADRGRTKKRLLNALWGARYLKTIAAALGVSETEAGVIRGVVLDKPVAALPIGIDSSAYKQHKTGYLTRHAPASVGKRVVLYFAYMHPNKGLTRLADAWLTLYRERPDWHLVLAGVDVDGLGAATMRRMQTAGAGPSVSLIGPAFGADKVDLLADADVFTMPSDSESFGIAFAESLASGVPIIATTGAPWSCVRDYRCGWWVEPTTDAVAAALGQATALSANDLRTMGDRGRAFVSGQFDWTTIASRARTLYEWMLGRAERPSFVRTG